MTHIIIYKAAMQELHNMGYLRQYLWVLTDNIRAKKFYEKNGFRSSGETRQIKILNCLLSETKYVNY